MGVVAHRPVVRACEAMSPQAISATAAVCGLIGMILLAVDRWVHRQDNNDRRFAERITALEECLKENDPSRIRERMDRLDKRFDEGNERSSREISRINAKVGDLEIELKLLKQREEMRAKRGSANARATREDIDRH